MKNILYLIIFGFLVSGCSALKKSTKYGSFTNKETQLIMKEDSLTPMRIFKITSKSDSILLRTKSNYVHVNANNLVLKTFINRLYRTVRDSMSLGVGIAAPQVGILKNIIWVQRFDKENFPFEVYLNPKITKYSSEKQVFREGCLSIPNRVDTVRTRAYNIIIEYDNINAEHKTETVEGFTSIIFQHEVDHLNGILYLDHLNKDLKDEENRN